MRTQSIKRLSISLALVLVALLFAALAVNLPSALARPSNIVNCAGPIEPCINSATNGDTIAIAPGTYNESLTLNKPVSLTGQSSATTVIHALNGQRVLTITGAAINSSVIISGLSFTGGNVSGGSDCPDNCGGGILITGTAQPLIQYVVISANRAYQGGGLFWSGGPIFNSPLTLTQVTIISNTSASIGGGLYASGTPRIYTSLFERNVGDIGGGVYAIGVYINQTDFISNTALDQGGGVQIDSPGHIQGGHFVGNSSSARGGAINGNNLFITNTEFVSNSTTFEGGGAIFEGINDTHLTNARFERNSSLEGGGALEVAAVIANGTTFVDNNGRHGGAIGTHYARVSGSHFENNRATFSGGALSTQGSVYVSNTEFISNSAPSGGGLIILGFSSGDSQIVNTLFARNKATTAGAEVYLAPDGTAEVVHSTFADTSANSKEAIVVARGTVYITNTIIVNHSIGISQTGHPALERDIAEDYNLFFGNTITTAGVITNGSHSLSGNPLFANPSVDDYHLLPGSAAIDKGANAGITSDVDGNTRPSGPGFDIGYDEWLDLPNKIYLPLVRKS